MSSSRKIALLDVYYNFYWMPCRTLTRRLVDQMIWAINKVSEVSRSNPSSDSRWPTLILKGAHRAIATWEHWLYFCHAPKFEAHFGHPITRNIPMLRSQIHHKTWRFLWFMVPRLLNPPTYRRLGQFLPRKSKKSWSPEVALVDFPPDGCPW